MKRFPATQIDVRLAIHDGDLLRARLIPPADSNCAAVSERIEIRAIPVEVSAYIQFIERMLEKK